MGILPTFKRNFIPLVWVLFFFLFLLLSSSQALCQTAEEADSAYYTGMEHYERQDYEQAIENLRKAAEIDRKQGETRLSDLAYDYKALAWCYFDLNQPENALYYFQQALDLFARSGDRAQELEVLHKMGLLYHSAGQYDGAVERYQKALSIAEQIGEKEQSIRILNNLGLVHYSRGFYEEAVEYYEQALSISEQFGPADEVPLMLNNLGLVYYAWGRYEQAIEYYEKAYSQNVRRGNDFYAATNEANIASVYLAWGKHPEAIQNYQEALEVFSTLGDTLNATNTRINIGMVYYSWGQFDRALELYQEALAQAEQHGLGATGIATVKGSMGSVYYAMGRYDRALEAFEQALDMFQEFSSPLNIASILSNIGMVYQAWGKYDQALEYYRQALELVEELGTPDQISLNLRLIGSVHQADRQFEHAIDYYTRSLEISRALGREADIPATLNTLGTAFFEWGRYEEAIDYYEQALSAAEKVGKKDEMVRGLIHIGGVYQVWGKTDGALDYYNRALKMAKEVGAQADLATCLNNLGTVYLNLKDYPQAIEYFLKAVAIKEELRLTASGDIRRDFLASWISTYRWLILTYVYDNKPEKAFDAIELIMARYLVEQMGVKLQEKDFSFSGIRSFQQKLNHTDALLDYANIGWEQSVVAYADRQVVLTTQLDKDEIIRTNSREYKREIEFTLEETRGFTMVPVEVEDTEEAGKVSFQDIIRYYRLLLVKPSLTARETAARENIGRQLYRLLIGPVEEYLVDKTELIIVPDGILAFLPFETLIMPDGKFLVERYHIRYTQSLAITELLERRRYHRQRKPLLAFGGAVYDELSYQTDMLVSAKQLEHFKKETLKAIQEKQSTRQAYSTLGIANWQNLPGTLTEVEAIGRIVPDSSVFTGPEVRESRIKSMSSQGSLKNYRAIHFATHGLVIPVIPELSAIVLSLFAQEQNQEDGYLTMKEIAALEIEADFINLSACETGLGKIYGGEGVVGLTQAFLLAGANGLSVSLWQVADVSTMEFMVGLYRLIQEQGLTYDRAMTEMKRAFIKENRFSQPFYWAPFVYYGK